MTDVGDATPVILETESGATVLATVDAPDGTPTVTDQSVPESPPGVYAFVFIPTSPGMWRVVMNASGPVTLVDQTWIDVLALGGLPPFATVQEYADRNLLTVTPEMVRQAGGHLADASDIIRSKMPTGYSPPAGVARSIVITMVNRVIANPGGRKWRAIGQVSESFDDKGGLFLTPSELDELLAEYEKAQESQTSGAYTVDLRDDGIALIGHVSEDGCWWG